MQEIFINLTSINWISTEHKNWSY